MSLCNKHPILRNNSLSHFRQKKHRFIIFSKGDLCEGRRLDSASEATPLTPYGTVIALWPTRPAARDAARAAPTSGAARGQAAHAGRRQPLIAGAERVAGWRQVPSLRDGGPCGVAVGS